MEPNKNRLGFSWVKHGFALGSIWQPKHNLNPLIHKSTTKLSLRHPVNMALSLNMAVGRVVRA